MMEGGLAEINTIKIDEDRKTVRVGNVRVFDLVGHGKDMIVECKGSRRDPVRANPRELLVKLYRQLNKP